MLMKLTVVWLCIFLEKNIGAKAAHKMLMNSTPGLVTLCRPSIPLFERPKGKTKCNCCADVACAAFTFSSKSKKVVDKW